MAKQNAEDFYFFWNGICSQWYSEDMVVDDITYVSCEQYMMAEKARLFGDDKSLEKIMAETDPHEIKALGKLVQGWNEPIWFEHREEIVFRGNYAKFSQHGDLKRWLLSTGDKIIVEASPYDEIWGIKMASNHPDILDLDKWRGLNLLGKAIMRVRDVLRQEAA